jgi:uncharacterized delta-60 repeat protein
MKNIFTFLFFALPGMFSTAQSCGPLDLTFGTGGRAIGLIVGPNTSVYSSAILIQPDGKIIQTGQSYAGNSTDFVVLRYNTNGSVDGTFGTNGKTFTSINQNSGTQCAVLQSDGKIVLGGYIYTQGNGDFILVRYNSNGSIDSSFGTNGKSISAISANWDYIQSLALQPDGKIVVVGITTGITSLCQIQSYSYPQAVIVRYNNNGSMDTTFGQKGKVFFGSGKYQDYANAVTVQPDGKILVALSAYYDCKCEDDYYGGLYWGCQKSFFLMQRFNTDGSLDNTFGKNGKATDSLLLSDPRKMILQSDGKIIVTGYGYQKGFITERYKSNGSLDSSFGTNGKVITQIGRDNDNITLNSAAIQSNGKLVLVGGVNNNTEASFVVVRYNPDGGLDNKFFTNGIAIFHVGPIGSYEVATGVVIKDSSIIAGGHFNYAQSYNMAIVRLLDTSLKSLGSIVTANGPLSFCGGGNVKLSTAVSGTLQWYNSGVVISGATGTEYTATVSGSYSVLANNANGCGISDPVIVKAYDNSAPDINWNGQLSFCEGGSVALFTSNTGSLQWYKNNSPIVGAIANIYTANSSGSYSLIATNPLGCSATSSVPVIVTVKSKTAPIVSSVGSLIFCEGGNVTLATTTSDGRQWYKNGNPINGATNATYIVTSSGSYTESNGCAVSNSVIVSVINNPPKPPITWNSTYYFSTTPGYVRYQWYLNNNAIPGADSVIYKPVQTGLYKVQVTNTANCSNRSDSFNLVLLSTADITVGDAKLR